jgi:hypothetical protein
MVPDSACKRAMRSERVEFSIGKRESNKEYGRGGPELPKPSDNDGEMDGDSGMHRDARQGKGSIPTIELNGESMRCGRASVG